MTPLQTAQLYFDLSNKSDFTGIERLFTETTTYSSQTTGRYVGVEDILKMQRAFHGKFSSLQWVINSVKEPEPGLIQFDYNFIGKLPNGDTVESSGLEDIKVDDGKIVAVEIRKK